MNAVLKAALKRLRAVEALNEPVTTATRAVMRAAGVESEAVVRHLHRVGKVSAPLPNGRTLRLWSRGDDWISNQVFWRGWDAYEAETTPLYFDLARRSRVTVDVGANVGYHTLLAAHANPAGRVVAFEPHPDLFRRLRRNVELNAVTNVQCHDVAAGDRTGEAVLRSPTSDLPITSSLTTVPGAAYTTTRTVKVVELDDILRETGVDLLKIDVEGAEPMVLGGMRGTLDRHRPAIVCEVISYAGTAEALHDLLDPFGYAYYHLTPGGPVRRERIVGHLEWRNYLMAPAANSLVMAGSFTTD